MLEFGSSMDKESRHGQTMPCMMDNGMKANFKVMVDSSMQMETSMKVNSTQTKQMEKVYTPRRQEKYMMAIGVKINHMVKGYRHLLMEIYIMASLVKVRNMDMGFIIGQINLYLRVIGRITSLKDMVNTFGLTEENMLVVGKTI